MEEPQRGILWVWSTDRDTSINEAGQPVNLNAKSFKTEPTVELKDQTYAFKWEERKKVCQKIKVADKVLHCVPAGETTALSKKAAIAHLKALSKLDYQNFDDLFKAVNSIRVLEINMAQWKLSTCTCSWWSKNYVCNQVIALSVRAGLFDFVDAAQAIPITQNRKRGHLANTQTALRRQAAETQGEEED